VFGLGDAAANHVSHGNVVAGVAALAYAALLMRLKSRERLFF
jgi:hypothetical protein